MTAPESWYATRTLRALEILAFRACSATEVAHGLQIHPRTARRLLSRLVADGYVSRSDGEPRVYSPTMRVVALAGQIVERSALAWQAVPFIEHLHRETGASSHLCVPSYDSVLCLVHRDGDDEGPVRPQMRELAPAHRSAAGRVLLAHRAGWRESVLARLGERSAVPPELAGIRERGFEIDEARERVSVAAPVFDPRGEAVAALVLAAAPDRIELAEAVRLVPTVAALLSADWAPSLQIP
jgi:DNA-binding IclR family transcriptional regulator